MCIRDRSGCKERNRQPRNSWFESECGKVIKEWNERKLKWLNKSTRQSLKECEDVRTHVKKIIRKKKREALVKEIEQIKVSRVSNEVTKFYGQVGTIHNGYMQ